MKNQNLVVYDEKSIASYIDGNYDYFIAGSDQIWNPDFAGNDFYFLDFAKPQQRIAFAASIGYETLPEKVLERYTKFWKEMKFQQFSISSSGCLKEKMQAIKVYLPDWKIFWENWIFVTGYKVGIRLFPKRISLTKGFEKSDAVMRQEYDRVSRIFAGIL